MIIAQDMPQPHGPDRFTPVRAAPQDKSVFVLQPRLLGLGHDMIIGGVRGPHYEVIDLSLLDDPVVIHWSGPDSGSITDGADSIVFQGIDHIILPDCMKPSFKIGAAA